MFANHRKWSARSFPSLLHLNWRSENSYLSPSLQVLTSPHGSESSEKPSLCAQSKFLSLRYPSDDGDVSTGLDFCTVLNFKQNFYWLCTQQIVLASGVKLDAKVILECSFIHDSGLHLLNLVHFTQGTWERVNRKNVSFLLLAGDLQIYLSAIKVSISVSRASLVGGAAFLAPLPLAVPLPLPLEVALPLPLPAPTLALNPLTPPAALYAPRTLNKNRRTTPLHTHWG